ncbi:hypothetical protein [Sorangium sp. So ce1335]|uniref:hypothetical protein n=1 Tax=Sorangium sp. So ce1335 TaxID=3133335 RepID=UPI003F6255A5
MRRSIRTGWLVSVMALSTLVACRGSGGEPSGGDGGHGGSGGGEAGGPDGVQACVDICEAHKMYGCDPPERNCAESCGLTLMLAGSGCEDELAAMYSCYMSGAAACEDGVPAECKDEEDAALSCVAADGCIGLECTYPHGVEGNECACSSTCLSKKHEVQCGPEADGKTMCACLVDGVEVGTCEGAEREVCHLKQGCCQEFFNLPL